MSLGTRFVIVSPVKIAWRNESVMKREERGNFFNHFYLIYIIYSINKNLSEYNLFVTPGSVGIRAMRISVASRDENGTEHPIPTGIVYHITD
jgi:hypothetical protein